MLAPFKYAGYPMLLQAVTLPTDKAQEAPGQHFLAAERTPQLQVSCLSCRVTGLRGRELLVNLPTLRHHLFLELPT